MGKFNSIFRDLSPFWIIVKMTERSAVLLQQLFSNIQQGRHFSSSQLRHLVPKHTYRSHTAGTTCRRPYHTTCNQPFNLHQSVILDISLDSGTQELSTLRELLFLVCTVLYCATIVRRPATCFMYIRHLRNRLPRCQKTIKLP